ncbi:protein-disulfide reductase DsbD family protein [Klebsiella michiganensis]|uniref:protein-disulfide reductase DsbD family protein n=1 Tax=Klebsiella michiganensis TaxID=1134687 RepID=UPI00254065B1|nr:protein-disulfide reductase DsbD domain-containing protein [Klebsiella michiganensis]MDK3051774.1 protein-disulfide reductase DsbD family protein [Klebsiella michiganensis]
MLNIFRGFVFLLLACAGVAHGADTGWLTSPQNDHARIRFQAEKGNDRIDGLLSIELASGWKTYWRSPGEGGVAPQIIWNNGEQARWYWPAPSRFKISGLTTQGYHDRVAIPMTIAAAPGDVLEGTLTLSTCSNVCLLTDYRLRLDFNQPADGDFRDAFARAMRTIPADTGITNDLAAHRVGSQLVITANATGEWKNAGIYFDPMDGGIVAGDPDIRAEGSHLKVTVPVTDEWGEIPATLAGKALSLVLTNGEKAQQINLTTGADLAPAATVSLGKIVLFALLGGLILNLMPCVLPVMGMKLSAVLQAGSDRGMVRLRFLATSAGILTSFALLALMVTILKLTGASLGWGIQFQNPWFIGLMVAVTFLFSLNLFGVVEMLLPSAAVSRLATAGGAGMAGSFCEGVFATLLATPCSAPFLGTAVAFALAAPLQELWLIFLVLGLGMAAPWLFVALFPQTAALLPRPGRWMNTLKMALGVMMLASSLWLTTLLGLHLGETAGGMLTLALTVAAPIALLVARPRATPAFWLVIIALAAFAGFQVRGLLAEGAIVSSPEANAQQIRWQPLSEAAIQSALADGKRVFIDISADWCVTCKVNEHRVLNQPAIISALAEPDVVALRGDWSKPSEPIARFLQSRNRYAIPFNQVYGPGVPQGETLPPLLDQQSVLNALTHARG